MYEQKEKPSYLDDWWFNFDIGALADTEFIVFAGAKDNSNKDFKIF
jgi:hypothetical protein